MGYDSSKFGLKGQGIARFAEWVYEDTGGESASGYQAAGFFGDAKEHGVDTGDSIVVVDLANTVVWRGHFITVDGTDTGDSQGTIRLDTGQP